ncbi:MAG TPA: DUF952 domain-containing protein [Lachnospiraceae bacterium]|nr:DUF952 domain-containing protein [Lachnospiraceae bacterium]
MIILHCMKKKTWEKVKNDVSFGKESLQVEGFLHCSQIEYWWRIAPNFRSVEEELVLLCINTEKLSSEIKWEDGDNCGRSYPHVYGEINMNAVVAVLPFIKDADSNYIKNKEFAEYMDK